MRSIGPILLFALAVVLFVGLGNVYLTNYDLMKREIILYGDERVRVWALILFVFLLGIILNVLLTGFLEVYRAVQGLNASAASRAGKRISVRLQEARELVVHGQYLRARNILDSILEEQPQHAAARIMKGELLQRLGDAEGAIGQFEVVAQAAPDSAEPRYLMAEAMASNRNPEGAIHTLKKIAGDHPKVALKALRRLRALQVDAQRWDEALEVHRKLVSQFASEVNPAEKAQGTALVYQAGLAKVDLDQFKEAAQAFQQVIKEDPAFIPAYLSLGRIMILQDQEPQGLEIWLEGFRATGEGALLQEIEDYFIQCGKPEEGLALLRRITATTQHATTAKFFLGKMLYRLEILDEALEQFQEVKAQVVYSPILYFFMAKIHSRRARLDAALNEYRQLLRNLGVLKLRFECDVCEHRTMDFVDRCESCGSWNSVHFLFKESDLPDAPLRPETGSGWLTMI